MEGKKSPSTRPRQSARVSVLIHCSFDNSSSLSVGDSSLYVPRDGVTSFGLARAEEVAIANTEASEDEEEEDIKDELMTAVAEGIEITVSVFRPLLYKEMG